MKPDWIKNIEFTKALKEQWISALKSGKYKKTDTYLKIVREGEVCHCALGVLVEEIYGSDIWVTEQHRSASLIPKEWDQSRYSDIVPLSDNDTREILWRNDRPSAAGDNYALAIEYIETLPTKG